MNKNNNNNNNEEEGYNNEAMDAASHAYNMVC